MWGYPENLLSSPPTVPWCMHCIGKDFSLVSLENRTPVSKCKCGERAHPTSSECEGVYIHPHTQHSIPYVATHSPGPSEMARVFVSHSICIVFTAHTGKPIYIHPHRPLAIQTRLDMLRHNCYMSGALLNPFLSLRKFPKPASLTETPKCKEGEERKEIRDEESLQLPQTFSTGWWGCGK